MEVLQLLFMCWICTIQFNPLNAELNPICCLLALLGAHNFLHVSRIRVNYTSQVHGSSLDCAVHVFTFLGYSDST